MNFTNLIARSNRPPSFERKSVRLTLAVLFLLTLVFPARMLRALDKTGAPAGTFDATTLRAPADLGPNWLVQGGDDPNYARPEFDDSRWVAFDIRKSLKSVFPTERPAVVWYRIHVQLAPDQRDLSLYERDISAALDLYVNGQRLLKVGEVSPFKPYNNTARLLVPVPNAQLGGGRLVIALRVAITRGAWSYPDPGLRVNQLFLGRETEQSEHIWLRVIGSNAVFWLSTLLAAGLGLVAFALYSAQPERKEYLWLFLQSLAQLASMPWILITIFHAISTDWGLVQLPINLTVFLFQTLMYLAFLRMRIGLWIKMYFAITGLLVIAAVLGVATGTLPTWVLPICIVPSSIFLNAVIPILLIVHLRRGNREAGILLIPALLNGLTYYVAILLFSLGQIPALEPTTSAIEDFLFNYHAGPFNLSLEDIGNLLVNVSLLLILVLRSNRMSRQQAVFEGELEAAREVQTVIVPEELDTVPGFEIESVYQPAQQVGGDFFQVLPASDGGLLLVVGDVAGKGLPAAMLVSVLVGAIRTVAEYTTSPSEVLASLNERLIGRSRGGFSTAIASHITKDGMVTIANAGHLPPYLDGDEIELPGALPLGLVVGTSYETIGFHLASGSRLTFYSDGVVEAQNEQKQLLGFERARGLSTQPAAAIAEAAKNFGQSDDITVVTITRLAPIASAA